MSREQNFDQHNVDLKMKGKASQKQVFESDRVRVNGGGEINPDQKYLAERGQGPITSAKASIQPNYFIGFVDTIPSEEGEEGKQGLILTQVDKFHQFRPQFKHLDEEKQNSMQARRNGGLSNASQAQKQGEK
mmetsp:Transcript_965/g.1723  ORF Transcript_965/g.1723 Transcript_965/m.1723 type:complete len:132 (+) Transcript_965:255-650(+)